MPIASQKVFAFSPNPSSTAFRTDDAHSLVLSDLGSKFVRCFVELSVKIETKTSINHG